jgi:hypothetical protein
MFTVMDVKLAEVQVLEVCNWNPLFPTVLELIEYYLTQGIIFSDDLLKTNN